MRSGLPHHHCLQELLLRDLRDRATHSLRATSTPVTAVFLLKSARDNKTRGEHKIFSKLLPQDLEPSISVGFARDTTILDDF